MPKKNSKNYRFRRIDLKADDGLLNLSIKAEIESTGFVEAEMEVRKYKLAALVHELARNMGFNPLEITVD